MSGTEEAGEVMGDHRATVRIEFHFHGETRKLDLNVNYSDDGDGIDNRVREFFNDAYTDGVMRHHAIETAEYRKRNAAVIEANERSELAKLKSKYEPAVIHHDVSDASRTGQPLTQSEKQR